MRKTARILTFTALSALVLSAPALAQGAMDGTGPIHVKAPFTYTGMIIDCLAGDGILLAIEGSDNVVIYGMGPESYWEAYGGRPAVGEFITVNGNTISYSGEERNIAWSVTLLNDFDDTEDDQYVLLRDELTGKPLWRSGVLSGGTDAGNGKNGRR